MLWSRGFLAVFICLLLSGCGFTPVYAPKITSSSGFSSIEITNIPNSNGQYLRNVLMDKIYTNGRPLSAAYTLSVLSLNTVKNNIGVGKDASVTRVQMRLGASITLTDNATGEKVLERDLRAFGGYNIFAGQYATMAATDAATKWALDDLAGQITRELALYFDRQNGGAP